MNLERGFRRIVLTISFAAASAGLVVTAYDTYEYIEYVSGKKNWVACVEEIHSRTLTEEDFWVKAAREDLLSDCKHFSTDRPTPFFPAMTQWYTTGREYNPVLRVWITPPSYTPALVVFIGGILASTGLGAIPWGVFYLVRWILQGFKV
jgi:hypothetical protein